MDHIGLSHSSAKQMAKAAPVKPAEQVLRLLYREAPRVIQRGAAKEFSRGTGVACFLFQVAGESGVVTLPYSKSFMPRGSDGFRAYTEAVIPLFVSRILTEKNYSPFRLEIISS